MPIDPVCHITVEPRHAAAFCEYKGVVYYFCSSGCHKTFTANIRRYTRDTDARDSKPSMLNARDI